MTNKYHRVQLAKKVYESLVNFQTYNPWQIANACYLIGFFPQNSNEKLFARNNLLNYFMNDLANIQDHLVYTEPTALEQRQLQYIQSKWSTEDLEKYIKDIDKQTEFDDDEEEFDPKSLKSLDYLFSAADVPLVERIDPKDILPDLPEEAKPLPNLEVEIKPFNPDKPPKRQYNRKK